MIHDRDVLPEEAPGGTSSSAPQPPAIDSEPRPPVTLGPYEVEYLGKRNGLRTLRIRAGRHTLSVFATLDGRASRISAELDGKKLTRRRKPRPWRRCSNDLVVKRWILAAAAETDDDGAPRWSCQQISHNLARSGRAQMSRQAVRNLIWRLAPALAKRRADYWKANRSKSRKSGKGARRKSKRGAALAAEREAVIAELKRANLL